MKTEKKGFIIIATTTVLCYAGIIHAQEYSPIENIMQQMETLKKAIADQKEEIRDLKVKLNGQTGKNIGNAFNETVFVREDLDQIVDKRIDEYFKKEETKEELSSHIKLPLDMGYEKGFYFQTHDGKFNMKTNGRFQFRYSFEDFDRKDDDSSFRIRRARLFFKGNAYSKYLKYFIQLRAESTGTKDRSKAVELFDWYVDLIRYPFAKIRFGQWKVPFNRQRVVSAGNLQLIDRSVANDEFALDRKYFIQLRAESTGTKDRSKAVELFDWYVDLIRYPFAKIRFGQWKVPFNRQRVVSAGNLQLIDRSVANDEFALDRQIGVQGFGKLFEKKLEYYFGFFNGNNRNESRNDNNEHMFIFRTSYNLLGGYGKGTSEVESDIAYSGTPLAHISGAIAFDSTEDVTMELESLGEFTASETDRTSVVAEYGFKYKGFSAIGEYYWRKTHGIADTNIIDQGFFAQAGYFLIPKKFEVSGRYSLIDFDDQLETDATRETTFGLNWFFAEHKSKLQFNAIRIDSEKPGPDDIDYKYRFQYQMSF